MAGSVRAPFPRRLGKNQPVGASGWTWSAATGQADWIEPRLSPFGADRADSVIPSGFEAYARLLHPVWRTRTGRERAVRWGEVAAWSGVGLQRLSQFHDIALPRQTPAQPAPWDSGGPAEGTLAGDDAGVLVGMLAAYTTSEQPCWYCLWDGYGWVPTAARVQLPMREYLLYTGSVAAALAFVDSWRQTPNLWWPEDRTWCVASEIDLPWSYLAGPEELIQTVLADPRLEALPAKPDDPIQLRVRGWLTDLVDDTVAELAEHGTATVTTSRGRVHARLIRPSRWRRGWLHTSTEAASGLSSDGDTALQSRSHDELLVELQSALTVAITGLVDR